MAKTKKFMLSVLVALFMACAALFGLALSGTPFSARAEGGEIVSLDVQIAPEKFIYEFHTSANVKDELSVTASLSTGEPVVLNAEQYEVSAFRSGSPLEGEFGYGPVTLQIEVTDASYSGTTSSALETNAREDEIIDLAVTDNRTPEQKVYTTTLVQMYKTYISVQGVYASEIYEADSPHAREDIGTNYSISGDFSNTETVAPENGVYSKDVTFSYTRTDRQTVESVYTVENITALKPVSFTASTYKSSYFVGNTFDPSGMVLTITYDTSGIVGAMPTVTKVCDDPAQISVGYFDSATNLEDPELDAFPYYENGFAPVNIYYTESGEKTSACLVYVDVTVAPVNEPDFAYYTGSDLSTRNQVKFSDLTTEIEDGVYSEELKPVQDSDLKFRYDAESGYCPLEQKFVLGGSDVNWRFDPEIMAVSVQEPEGAEPASITTSESTAEITFVDSGTYVITVSLTEQGYYWVSGYSQQFDKDTVTYTVVVDKAKHGDYSADEFGVLLDESAKTELDNGEEEAGWTYNTQNAGENLSAFGNFENAEVTYTYGGNENGASGAYSRTTVHAADETPSVPQNAGSYTVTVSFAESANFYASQASQELSFYIGKAELTPATTGGQGTYDGDLGVIDSQTYTGSQLTAQKPAQDAWKPYDVVQSGSSQIDADPNGYTVSLNISQLYNYRWAEPDASASGKFDNSEVFASKQAAFEITPASVQKPSLSLNDQNRTYTGSRLSAAFVFGSEIGGSFSVAQVFGDSFADPLTGAARPSGFSGAVPAGTYGISGSGNAYTAYALHAGTYTFTVSLNNPERYQNFVWADGGHAEYTFAWVIARASDQTLTTFEVDGGGWTFGASNLADSLAAVLKYAKNADGADIGTVPGEEDCGVTYTYEYRAFGTDGSAWKKYDEVPGAESPAGYYRITAVVKETADFEASQSQQLTFTIARQGIQINGGDVSVSNDKTEYTGENILVKLSSDELYASYYDVEVRYQGAVVTAGTPRAVVNAAVYEVVVTPKSDYSWADGTTQSVTLSWTVSPKAVSVPELQVGASNNIYTAQQLTAAIQFNGLTVGDGAKDAIASVAKGTADRPAGWSGEGWTPADWGVNADSESVYATSAGEYTFILSLNNPEGFTNYVWNDPTGGSGTRELAWTIARAQDEILSFVVNGWIYDNDKGFEGSYTVSQKFEDGSVSFRYYKKNGNSWQEVSVPTAASDAGIYRAVAVAEETANYTASPAYGAEDSDAAVAEFEIDKKRLAIPELPAGDYYYTGSDQQIALENFNVSADGSKTPSQSVVMIASVSGSPTGFDAEAGTVTAINAAEYTITLRLANTVNYEWQGGETADETLSWKISPRGIYRPSFGGEAQYATVFNEAVQSYTLPDFGKGDTLGVNDGSGEYPNALIVEQASASDEFYEPVGGAELSVYNAGTYTVEISLASTQNYSWIGEGPSVITLTWTVSKAQITRPSFGGELVYDQTRLSYHPQTYAIVEQSVSVDGFTTAIPGGSGSYENAWTIAYDEMRLTVSDGGRLSTSAANEEGYTIKFTLSGGNYEWATENEGSKTDEITLIWQVKKAIVFIDLENDTINQRQLERDANGAPKYPEALLSGGTASAVPALYSFVEYQILQDGEYVKFTEEGGDGIPSEFGTYYAVLSLVDPDNFEWSSDETLGDLADVIGVQQIKVWYRITGTTYQNQIEVLFEGYTFGDASFEAPSVQARSGSGFDLSLVYAEGVEVTYGYFTSEETSDWGNAFGGTYTVSNWQGTIENVPAQAGTYWLRVQINAPANNSYASANIVSEPFEVQAKSVSSEDVQWSTFAPVYTGGTFAYDSEGGFAAPAEGAYASFTTYVYSYSGGQFVAEEKTAWLALSIAGYEAPSSEVAGADGFKNAGKYTFSVQLPEDDADHSFLAANYSLAGGITGKYTVAQRQLTFKIDAPDVVYNGAEQRAAVTYEVVGEGLVVPVTEGETYSVGYSGTPLAAKEYTVTVSIQDENFVFSASSAREETYTIEQKELRLTVSARQMYGNKLASFAYTEAGTPAVGKYTVAAEPEYGFAEGEGWQTLLDEGVAFGFVTSYTDGAAYNGSYTVELNFTSLPNNYTIAFAEGTLSVVQRAIAVTVKEGAYSDYGAAPSVNNFEEGDLAGDGVYAGDLVAEAQGLARYANVFALTPSDGETALTAQSDVGTYDIRAVRVSENYSITFRYGSYEGENAYLAANAYEIRAIALDSNSANIAVVWLQAAQYGGDSRPVASGLSQSTAVNEQAITWYFRIEGVTSGWVTEIPTVLDADEYEVSYYVTAANHISFGSQEQPKTYTVAIDLRVVTIDWSDNDFTYSGIDQFGAVTASYTLYEDGEPAGSQRLDVTLGGEKTGFLAAGEDYAFQAAFLSGDTGSKNYTLKDAADTTARFDMKQKKVTVRIENRTDDYGSEEIAVFEEEDASFAYGEDLTADDNKFYSGDLAAEGVSWSTLFTLYTTATSLSDVVEGGYRIYAEANGENAGNYSITFTGDAEHGGEPAGIHTLQAIKFGETDSTFSRYGSLAEGIYTAVYDGEEHSVAVKLPSSTAVNGQAITWYFRIGESGEYTPLTGGGEISLTVRNAQSYIVQFYAEAPNHNRFEGESYTIRIDPYTVSEIEWTQNTAEGQEYYIVYDGAEHSYGNGAEYEIRVSYATVGTDAQENGGRAYLDLVIGEYRNAADRPVSSDVMKNAGAYTFTASLPASVSNYVLIADLEEELARRYVIAQKALSVAADEKEITYGAELSAVNFTYSYSGFVPSEEESRGDLTGEIGYLLKTQDGSADAVYSAGETPAGTVFVLEPYNISSNNYAIQFEKTGTLTVVQRELTVHIYPQSITFGQTSDIPDPENDGKSAYTVAEGTVHEGGSIAEIIRIYVTASENGTWDTRFTVGSLTAQGSYYIRGENLDEINYRVTFKGLAGSEGSWEVTGLDYAVYSVGQQTVTIVIGGDTGSNVVYDGLPVKNTITEIGAAGITAEDVELEYFTKDDGGAWTVEFDGIPVNVGEYLVRARITNDNYISSSTSYAMITIVAREVSIVWKVDGVVAADTQWGVYDGETHTVTAEYVPVGNDNPEGTTVVPLSVFMTEALWADGKTPLEAFGYAGSYAFRAEFAEQDNPLKNYVLPEKNTKEYTIAQSSITVTIHDVSRTYGHESLANVSSLLIYSVSGDTYGDEESDIFSLSAEVTKTSPVDEYDIVGSFEGTPKGYNYAVTWNGQSTGIGEWGVFTVSRATLTVATNANSVVYGNAVTDGYFTVGISGFVNGETREGLVQSGELDESGLSFGDFGGYTAGAAAGSSFEVLPAGLSAKNYSFSYVAGTLTVVQRELTVQIGEVAAMTYGSSDVEETYNSIVGNPLSHVTLSSANGSGTAVFEGDRVFSLSVVTAAGAAPQGGFDAYTSAGTYYVFGSADGADAANYAVTFKNAQGGEIEAAADGTPFVIKRASIEAAVEEIEVTYTGVAFDIRETAESKIRVTLANADENEWSIAFYSDEDRLVPIQSLLNVSDSKTVYFRVTARAADSADVVNHDPAEGSFSFEIAKAAPAIADQYGNDYSYGGPLQNWTYNAFDELYENGYSANNPNGAVLPVLAIGESSATNFPEGAQGSGLVRYEFYKNYTGTAETSGQDYVYYSGGEFEEAIASLGHETDAGTYWVRVWMEEGDNYKGFEAAFRITVSKYRLSLGWEWQDAEGNPQYSSDVIWRDLNGDGQGDEIRVYLTGFDGELMTVAAFPSNVSSENRSPEGDGDYPWVDVTEVGAYTFSLEIKTEHWNNYCWARDTASRTIQWTFSVSTARNTITSLQLQINGGGWIDILGKDTSENPQIVYGDSWRAQAADLSGSLNVQVSFAAGKESESPENLSYSMSVPSDAGGYWIYVIAFGTGDYGVATAYEYVEISTFKGNELETRYSREDWEYGSSAAAETRPSAVYGTVVLTYYTQADGSDASRYTGNFDEHTPAGTYYVYAEVRQVLNANGTYNYNSIPKTCVGEFTVERQGVAVVTLGDTGSAMSDAAVFNNSVQTVALTGFKPQLMSITGSTGGGVLSPTADGGRTLSASEANTYTVTVELVSANYKWVNAEGADYNSGELYLELFWTINPATVTPGELPAAEGGVYNGSPFGVTEDAVAYVDGSPVDYVANIVYTYYDAKTETPLEGAPSAAGTYIVVARAAATNNYDNGSGEDIVWQAVKFVIEAADIEYSVKGYEGVYDGAAHNFALRSASAVDGSEITWEYGTQKGEYTSTMPSFTDHGTHVFFVRLTAENHKEAVVEVAVTIAQREVEIVWSNNGGSYTYGYTNQWYTAQAYYLPYSNGSRLEDTEENRVYLSVTDGGEFKDYAEGGYTFEADFAEGDNAAGNYRLPAVASQTYSVAKAAITVAVDAAGHTYGEGMSELTYTVSGATYGEEKPVFTLEVEGCGKESSAGTYDIVYYLGAAGGNYAVSFVGYDGASEGEKVGEYVVSPRALTVEIAFEGELVYGGQWDVSVEFGNAAFGQEDQIRYSLAYTGTANSGEPFGVPAEAGSYRVTVSLDDSDAVTKNYILSGITYRDYTVSKQQVEIPTAAQGLVFNNELQNWGIVIEEDALYTLEDGGMTEATDAGSYSAVLRLKDADNTVWVSGTATVSGETCTVGWSIAKAQFGEDYTVTQPSAADKTYDGSAAEIQSYAVVEFVGGSVLEDETQSVIRYSFRNVLQEDIPSNYILTAPTDAGTYVVRAWVAETSNYSEGWSDAFEFTIGKAEYDMSAVTFGADETRVEYDGSAHILSVSAEELLLVEGRDHSRPAVSGYTYSKVTEGESESVSADQLVDAGRYEITVTFAAGSGNYLAPAEMTAVLVVQPKVLDGSLVWAENSFTYNGREQNTGVYAEYESVEGGMIRISAVCAEKFKDYKESGYEFTVNAFTSADGNYILNASETRTYDISKAGLTVSVSSEGHVYGADALGAVSFEIVEGTNYDGSDVFTLETEADLQSPAGTYAVVYTLGSRAGNYELAFAGYENAGEGEKVGEYVVSARVFGADSEDIHITVQGNLYYEEGVRKPAVAGYVGSEGFGDELTFTYFYTGTTTRGTEYGSSDAPMVAGEYTVTVSSSASNFILENVTYSFTIARAVVADPEISSKAYTGYAQSADIPASTLYTAESNIGGVNADEYDVVLVLTDAYNYQWSEPDEAGGAKKTFTFRIVRAENEVSDPSMDGWTYGQAAASPSASADFGDVLYRYYSESMELLSGRPENAGSYYVQAYVEGTANWSEASSAAVPFTVSRASLSLALSVGGWTYGEDPNGYVLSGNLGEGAVTLLYEGETNGGEQYSGASAPEEAGSYTLTATVAQTQNYLGGTAEAAFTVSRAQLAPSLAIDGWTYGEEANEFVLSAVGVSADALEEYIAGVRYYNDSYDASSAPENAGYYRLIVQIGQSPNYTAGYATATFTIAKAAGAPVLSLEGWTYGDEANLPQVSGSHGGLITYRYTGTANSGDGWDSASAPTAAGTYKLTVTVGETQNYTAGTAEVSFTVARRLVAAPTLGNTGLQSIVTDAEDGMQTLALTGYDANVMGVSGTDTVAGFIVDAEGNVLVLAPDFGTYSVTVFLKDTNNYQWSGAEAGAETANLVLTWTLEETVQSILWLVFTLSGVVVVELILLAVALVKGKKNGGSGGPEEGEGGAPDGSGPDSGNAAAGGQGQTVNTYSFAPLGLLLFAAPLGEVAACIALGVAVVGLAVADGVLFARLRKKGEAEQPEVQPAAEEPEPSYLPVSAELYALEILPAPAEEKAPEPVVPEESPSAELASAEDEDADEMLAFDGKVFVRYDYSFRAKLIRSTAEVQERYGSIADDFVSYQKVKSAESWKKVRFYKGRTPLAQALFKGRTLCIAFALDPKEYENTKYRGEDMSEFKRFEKTPMLLRITSDRRARYAKYLFAQLAERYGLEKGETVATEHLLPSETVQQLIDRKLIKVLSSGEIGEGVQAEPADVLRVIQENISFSAAESAAESAEEPPAPPVAEELASAAEIAEEEEFDEDDDADIADLFDESEESEGADGAAILAGFDGSKILIRYNYSFRAKLIQAPAEVQSRYGEIMDEIRAYDGVKTNISWKQVRVYKGRQTLAVILFKGRKLCVAFGLDPKEYENTKYRGADLSAVKRYQKTPLLMKLSSPRKVRYAKHLLSDLFERYGIEKGEAEHTEFGLPYRTTEQLVSEGLVKVLSSEALSEGAETEQADIAMLIRERITLSEAQTALTDEAAAAMIEEETPPEEPAEESPAQPAGEEPSEEETAAPAVVQPERRAPKRREEPASDTRGRRGIVNVDSLSRAFAAGETVTLRALKEKKIISPKAKSYKVLARGVLDKPLVVEANDFSLDAVKMIVLTGGKAIKIHP